MSTSALAPAAAAARPRSGWLGRALALEQLDNRYPALHGLRVLAILSVIQFHVTWILTGEQGLRMHRGFVGTSLSVFFGMDLFFVLSGFLIGSIVLRDLDAAGTPLFGRFYLRRVFRTFPSYYLVLTFLVLITPLTAAQRAHLPREYLYMTNYLPLGRTDALMFWGWSLALEEQFYLVVPLIFAALHRLRGDRARLALLVLLWAGGTAMRLAVYLGRDHWTDLELYGALYFRTHTRYDTLVAGMVLAVVHRRWGPAISVWLGRPFHRALLALPALACLWILLEPTAFGAEHVQLVHVFAWGTITSVMYVCALLLLLRGNDGGGPGREPGAIARALSAPAWRSVATLGYGVYLVHIPIIDRAIVPAAHVLHARHLPWPVLWLGSLAVCVAVSLALAYALHLLVEKPALRLRDRLAG